MCRWMLFFGDHKVLAADIITKPRHSIVNQCYDHYLPQIASNWTLSTLVHQSKVNHFINGDGFGLGWYCFDIDPTPCVYTCVTPPWSNRNFYRLVEKIKSECLFCHIRAASLSTAVSEANCHPYQFGRYLFMHNGTIAHFHDMKVKFLQAISPNLIGEIKGTTDTEHAAALFITKLGGPNEEHTLEEMKSALLQVIKFIVETGYLTQVKMAHNLNFAVTDGKKVVTTRYRSSLEDPPSLYYRIDSQVVGHEEHIEFKTTSTHHRAIMIASEPLTYDPTGWHLIPRNSIVSVGSNIEPVIEPIYIGTLVHLIALRWIRFTRRRRALREKSGCRKILTQSANSGL